MTLALLKEKQFSRRILERDASLWTDDPEEMRVIRNRLGWLFAVQAMKQKARELKAFAQELRREGFDRALVLGMGGSSLFPDVCRRLFGASRGGLKLDVLDSTDPAWILEKARWCAGGKTLFIVSSKSGTTAETMALFSYFYDWVQQAGGTAVGKAFTAITDPNTPLEGLAGERGFRRTFLNPPDIGGRYAALSFVGLVPCALLGVDVDVLLEQARGMEEELMRPTYSGEGAENPGIELAARLAECAAAGRDKITFVFSPSLASFGIWLEQLIAESTGKEGKGLIPVDGEVLGEPDVYGLDRVFVSVGLKRDEDAVTQRRLGMLEKRGHPVLRFTLDGPLSIGAECLRWEYATAALASLWGINPFNEPDVDLSKDRARALLEAAGKPQREEPSPRSMGESLADFLHAAREGDYVVFMAYLAPTPQVDSGLQALRIKVRDRFRKATVVGYGPRFLHSTGQLHKGGPGTGVFIQLTADDTDDMPIPGKRYSFGALKRAQAMGDLEVLKTKGRRCMRIHLGQEAYPALNCLREALA
ncbi:MAG: glucose-6-phosphate isomerase [Candidatus Omnitrophica bacterium]|nr:glucose-6-phosphate isomerase [Candidatus Omnitrophota bacterium]